MAGTAQPSSPSSSAATAAWDDADLTDDLLAAIDPLQILVLLRVRAGMTQADIAQAVGANVRSVRGWETGVEPRLRAADRLRVLAEVVATLAETMTPRGINLWLRHRSRRLDGDRPLERLVTDPERVLEEAAAVGEVRHD